MIQKIINIGAVATWSETEQSVVTQENVELQITDGIITDIAAEVMNAEEAIDVDGALITPGFIDPHTHPVFAGHRANEFKLRVAGRTYEEIAAQGGGIITSIQGVRNTDIDELFQQTQVRLDAFLLHGTTTIEAKSGYGLDMESELKSLRVLRNLIGETPLDIVPTFLGAHAFPPEYASNHEAYVDLICNEMIPAVAEEELAEYCDVFCEKGYFTVDQSRRILETALKYSLKPRMHADEFIDSGAAELAGELGAISADHLMAVSPAGIKALADNNVIATLLPGTTLFLGKTEYADGRRLIDSGVEVALATDFNPGSCTLTNMPVVMSLATLYCGLTVEEAFKAATYSAARAVARERFLGCIAPGYQADLIIWNLSGLSEIPYWLGSDNILAIMKKGELIERRLESRYSGI